MAKLQTYKFVNPGVSNTKSPTVAAARRQTLALNRLGSTISGIGSVVSDIERISIRQIKNDKLRERAERRRDRRELDQAAEEAMPILSNSGLETTPSGGAGLAALLSGFPGINQNSRVLCIVSEESDT